MSLEQQPPRRRSQYGLFGREKFSGTDTLIQFAGAIANEQWDGAFNLLEQLAVGIGRSDPALCSFLEENYNRSNGYAPIHKMIVEAQIKLLSKLHKIGVNIFGQTSPRSGDPIPALHLATELGVVDSVELLIDLGADVEGLNASGKTALRVAIESSGRGYQKDRIVEVLLQAGADLAVVPDSVLHGAYLQGQTINADLRGRDLRNANLIDADLSAARLDQALLQDAIYSARTLFPPNFNPGEYGMLAGTHVHNGENEDQMSEDELIAHNLQDPPWGYLCGNDANELQRELAYGLAADEQNLRQMGASERDIFHYRAAFICSDNPGQERQSLGHPFLRLFPALTTNFPPGSVNSLLSGFESELDGFDPPQGTHSNMAEFFALLNHPGLNELTSETVGVLTSLITAADRWLDKDSETDISIEHVKAWRDLGFISFAHLGLKYDAMRTFDAGLRMPCLLERFGFERIQPRETDFEYEIGNQTFSGYGPGYQLRVDSSNRELLEQHGFPVKRPFYLEARRGYFLLSFEGLGTLVVRNSSAHFGRDLLPVPALYSHQAINTPLHERDLQLLDDAEVYASYQSVLNVDLNLKKKHFDNRLLTLTSALRAFLNAYDAWKFDTEYPRAYKDFDGDIVGGYNSVGFASVVDDLELRMEATFDNPNAVMPALAFAAHAQPAWNFCPWEDRKGIEHRKFPINRPRLDVLRALANGGRFAVSDLDLAETEVRSFFEAGFHYQGRLVLVDPDQEKL